MCSHDATDSYVSDSHINEAIENIQVIPSSSANGTSSQVVMNDSSFKNFGDLAHHTDVANDMLHGISCEECYVQKERCKRILLSMCIGIMKGGEPFDYENDDAHSKCPPITMRKLCLTRNKYLHNEVVCRNYRVSRNIKNARVGLSPKVKNG